MMQRIGFLTISIAAGLAIVHPFFIAPSYQRNFDRLRSQSGSFKNINKVYSSWFDERVSRINDVNACALFQKQKSVITRQLIRPSKAELPKEKFFERLTTMISQRRNAKRVYPVFREMKSEKDKRLTQTLTLVRVGIPSVLSAVVATLVFPFIAMLLATYITDPGVFSVLSTDSSQFVQNFLSVASLLFSILVGQTCKYATLRHRVHCRKTYLWKLCCWLVNPDLSSLIEQPLKSHDEFVGSVI